MVAEKTIVAVENQPNGAFVWIRKGEELTSLKMPIGIIHIEPKEFNEFFLNPPDELRNSN
jgi:hypothetical protein